MRLPNGSPHNRFALVKMMTKLDLKCAFYIGDDDTDEDVVSLPDRRIISVRIGKKMLLRHAFFCKGKVKSTNCLKC
jgi:hypothetical protein